jgi:hypothetical protein
MARAGNLLMTTDVADLINESWPFISAAAAGYGTAVIKNAQDSVASATVTRGRQIIKRIFEKRDISHELEDYAQNKDDAGREKALRNVIARALSEDQIAAEEVRSLLNAEVAPPRCSPSPAISNSVDRSTVQGSIIQAEKIDKIEIHGK